MGYSPRSRAREMEWEPQREDDRGFAGRHCVEHGGDIRVIRPSRAACYVNVSRCRDGCTHSPVFLSSFLPFK